MNKISQQNNFLHKVNYKFCRSRGKCTVIYQKTIGRSLHEMRGPSTNAQHIAWLLHDYPRNLDSEIGTVFLSTKHIAIITSREGSNK